MSNVSLTLADVSAALGGLTVVSGVSLALDAGSFVAIVGPNGAGKTTLLRAVAGLTPFAGAIAVNGQALASLPRRVQAQRIAYLPQGHVFHWPLAVSDVVALGRLPQGMGDVLSEADRDAVVAAMTETGTLAFADRAVTTLSGGERARVAMARVLATQAPIILADEPTASLDPHYQIAIVEMLRRHAASAGIVVAVVHDLGLAARHADRIVVLDGGRIVADGAPRTVLTAERLAATFGVAAEVIDVRGAPVVVPWSISAPR
jgi:iron complex transport system ATP-binding protein